MIKLGTYNWTLIICLIFTLKVLALGADSVDLLLVSVAILGIELNKVISHIFPKREDLNKEVKELRDQLNSLQAKLDDHETDLTALKFHSSIKRT